MQYKPIFLAEMEGSKKYYLKAVTRINNKITTTLTSYPTTEGTPMSDHAYREPYSISVSIVSSELNSSKNFYYISSDNDNSEVIIKSDELKKILLDWKENFTRLILQTRHYQFKNMIISDIDWTDDDNTLGKFDPTITFSECRVASVYTEKLGPFNSDETSGTYNDERDFGNSNGVDVGETIGGTLSGAVGGAVAGAVLGSVIPGVGNVAGAIIGGCYGAIKSFGNKLGWW